MLDNYRHTSYNINITIKVSTMSHAVNDEIIENIYDELIDEYGVTLESWTHEMLDRAVMQRFEAMS